jgi:hypothetical protein
MPTVVHFRNWLTVKIETNLKALPDQHYELSRPEAIKIVNISFAYNNDRVIKLLRQRGDAIKEAKWEEVTKIE